MRRMAVAAAAAALMTFADFGLARAAPQPVKRGSLDVSSPYIPPAKRKLTSAEKILVADRRLAAEQKRKRKAEKLRALVASGALAAA